MSVKSVSFKCDGLPRDQNGAERDEMRLNEQTGWVEMNADQEQTGGRSGWDYNGLMIVKLFFYGGIFTSLLRGLGFYNSSVK